MSTSLRALSTSWTLVVEDEPRLQRQLLDLLAACAPDLGPFHAAASVEEALALCRDGLPSIAFLDIRLPGLSGIELARQLAGGSRLVMVTAYDQYAVQAFEAQAVDYRLLGSLARPPPS